MYADSKLDGRENTDDGLQGEKRQKGEVNKKDPSCERGYWRKKRV
jgi:hypothetical protein